MNSPAQLQALPCSQSLLRWCRWIFSIRSPAGFVPRGGAQLKAAASARSLDLRCWRILWTSSNTAWRGQLGRDLFLSGVDTPIPWHFWLMRLRVASHGALILSVPMVMWLGNWIPNESVTCWTSPPSHGARFQRCSDTSLRCCHCVWKRWSNRCSTPCRVV